MSDAPAKPTKHAADPAPKPVDPVANTPKFVMIDDPVIFDAGYFSIWPFDELDVDQGFFVLNDDLKNKDELKAKGISPLDYFRGEIYRANDYYATDEHDAEGSKISVEMFVEGVKPDGTITAEVIRRPLRIYSRHYSAHAVTVDDDISDGEKAPGNGVLVIREA